MDLGLIVGKAERFVNKIIVDVICGLSLSGCRVLDGVLAAEAVEHAGLLAAVRGRDRLPRDGVADAAKHAVLLQIRIDDEVQKL